MDLEGLEHEWDNQSDSGFQTMTGKEQVKDRTDASPRVMCTFHRRNEHPKEICKRRSFLEKNEERRLPMWFNPGLDSYYELKAQPCLFEG